MEHRLQELYALPPVDRYLLDLVEQCGRLEAQLLELSEQLPSHQRYIVECYIEVRNELDFQSVKRALRAGSSLVLGPKPPPSGGGLGTFVHFASLSPGEKCGYFPKFSIAWESTTMYNRPRN